MNSDEERSEGQTGVSQTGSKEPPEPADSEADERVCGGRLLHITKDLNSFKMRAGVSRLTT